MLKRKSSKLMSGTGAVAIVASLSSMSTAAEIIILLNKLGEC
jgi:hypothetical protein